MPLNIKSERAHDLARQLADQTGESLTKVVVDALEEKLARLTSVTDMLARAKIERMNAAAMRIAARPAADARSLEDMLYDENGLPK